jgi:hypothetical protein
VPEHHVDDACGERRLPERERRAEVGRAERAREGAGENERSDDRQQVVSILSSCSLIDPPRGRRSSHSPFERGHEGGHLEARLLCRQQLLGRPAPAEAAQAALAVLEGEVCQRAGSAR